MIGFQSYSWKVLLRTQTEVTIYSLLLQAVIYDSHLLTLRDNIFKMFINSIRRI